MKAGGFQGCHHSVCAAARCAYRAELTSL